MLSFLMVVGVIIWVTVINSKISTLSRNVDKLNKKISDIVLKDYTESSNKSNAEKVKENSTEAVVEETAVTSGKECVEEQQTVLKDASVEEVKCQKVCEEITSGVDEPKRVNKDIQSVIIGNIFNKIGAVAIIIAMVILVKLVSGYFSITEEMKFCFGLIFSGVTLGLGFYLRTKEKFKVFSEVVLGLGFAVSFIMFFCGYSLWHLYQAEAILIIGGLLLSVMFLIAHTMKTPSLPIIALIGGYLTPAFAQGTFDITFAYVIFLNAVSLIFTLRNKNFKFINLLNLLISFPILMIGFCTNHNISVVYPLLFWLIYVIYDLLRDKVSILDNVYTFLNYIILTLLTVVAFHEAQGMLAILFGVTALGYLILSLVSRHSKNDLYKIYESFCFVNIWLFIVFELSDLASVLTWAVITLVLTIFAVYGKQKHLDKIATVYALTTMAGTLFAHIDGHYCLSYHYPSLLNMRTLVFLIPAVLILLSAYIYNTKKDSHANIFNLCGLSILYIYLSAEISSCIYRNASGFITDFTQQLSCVILAFAYSLHLNYLAKSSKSILLNVFANITLFCALIVLLCLSFWYPKGYVVILNMCCLAYIIAIITLIIKAKWSSNVFYKVLAIFLGFMLVYNESTSIPKLYGDVWTYVVSVAWVLYSALITLAGIFLKRKYLLNSGIVIFLITILRIFIFDLALVEPIFKLIAFMVLGLILMLVSFMYIKLDKR